MGEGDSASKKSPDTIRVEPNLNAPEEPDLTIDPLLPPGAEARPPAAGELGRTRSESGLPILDPKGPQLQKLFESDAGSDEKRFTRLENAVVEIRRDLDAALPAINRLVAIESDIQELVGQLQTLLSEERAGPGTPLPPAAPVDGDSLEPLDSPQAIEPVINADLMPEEEGTPAPKREPPVPRAVPAVVDPLPPLELEPVEADAPEPTPAAPEKPKAVAKSPVSKPGLPVPGRKPARAGGQTASAAASTITPPAAAAPSADKTLSVRDIRLGVHQDKIRIVIESPIKTAFTADLDNAERVLVVDIPGVKMVAGRAEVGDNTHIATMSTQASGQIVFDMKKDSKVLQTSTLPPAAGSKRHRLVIDLQ